MAVEIASKRLAELPRSKRLMWIHAATSLISGAITIVLGQPLFGAVLFVSAATAAATALWGLARYAQPRWEQARRLNTARIGPRA